MWPALIVSLIGGIFASAVLAADLSDPALVANAGEDFKVCVNEVAPFDATRTQTPVKGLLFAKWKMGDGTEKLGAKVTHIYKRRGRYRAQVTVLNASLVDSPKSSDSVTVTVNSPPKAHLRIPAKKNFIGEAILFNAARSNDPDGQRLKFLWDFGDGTIEEGPKKIKHLYENPGEYNVTVRVDDQQGTACSQQIARKFIKVTGQFQAAAGENLTACLGEAILFDASNSLGISDQAFKFFWDFGDGQTSQGLKANHVYSEPGIYQANLTVTSKKRGQGRSVASRLIFINTPPLISLEPKVLSCAGEEIVLHASPFDREGDSLKFSWDLGEGTQLESGHSISHRYFQEGTYSVTVTADDGKKTACSRAQAASQIEVLPAPCTD